MSNLNTRAIRLTGAILVTLLLFAFVAAGVGSAAPVVGDFIAHDTGGQAVLEDMVVRPQAVYYDGVTYIAYQGPGLNPYVIAYDNVRRTWVGPQRVGANPLATARDMHGAPAITVDSAGYLHVFYGSHGGYIRHAKSPGSRSILMSTPESTWPTGPSLTGRSTYAQPYYVSNPSRGSHVLVARRDTPTGELFTAKPYLSGWVANKLRDGALSWDSTTTPIVRDSDGLRWYTNTTRDPVTGDIHAAMVALRDLAPDPYSRNTVYYLKMTPDGHRYTAAGIEITATVEPGWDNPENQYDPALYGPYEGDLIDAGAMVFAPHSGDEQQNQVVVEIDPSGDPTILFLSGDGNSYQWRFSRWDDSSKTWRQNTICETDQFFDAATFEFRSETSISAYVTAEGGVEPLTQTTNRGGSIIRYDSTDGGENWDRGVSLRTAEPLYGERYNDPQLVSVTPLSGDLPPEARVLFCQWDNAGVNFVNKLFLSSDIGTLLQKEVTSKFTRLSGLDRVGTAIAISRESFPLGSNWVVLASSENFPDALAGVPLASAFGAPILLVPKSGLTPELVTELQRLRVSGAWSADSGVIILGGTVAIPDAVKDQVATALAATSSYTVSRFKSKVSREAGANRFETAIEIAERLEERRGVTPSKAVVVSGESFADALAISPVAAVNGWPILLTQSSVMTTQTVNYVTSLGVIKTYVIGGSSVVTVTAESRLPGVQRIAGMNRYKTSYAVASFGAENGLRRERLTIASGETFPDALAGGVLAARIRGPLLITAPQLAASGELESGLRILLATSSSKALEWYILGGEKAVGTPVATEISSYLPSTAP